MLTIRLLRLQKIPGCDVLPAYRSQRRAMSALYSSKLILTPSDLVALSAKRELDVVPIDVTWFMPNVARDPQAEFRIRRIPTARRLDLDVVASDHSLGLKHMMPSGAVFAEACSKWLTCLSELGADATVRGHRGLAVLSCCFVSPRVLEITSILTSEASATIQLESSRLLVLYSCLRSLAVPAVHRLNLVLTSPNRSS